MPAALLYIIGGIIVLTIVLYFIQDKFIFKPERLPADFKFNYDAPFEELFFDIQPGVRINGLHFYVKDPLGLILYFHGNSRSIKGWVKYAKDFYRYRYDVVLVDYRGFGKSTGRRSEAKILSETATSILFMAQNTGSYLSATAKNCNNSIPAKLPYCGSMVADIIIYLRFPNTTIL